MSKKTFLAIVLTFAISLGIGAAPASSANERASVEPRSPLAPAADRLSAEIQISVPASPDIDRHKPAVAYNSLHDEYLVVWHNTWPTTRDIYARRVSANGTPIGNPFVITSVHWDRFQPAVAYNAKNDEYLIVWMYDAANNGTLYEIYGKIISWDGTQKTAERKIFGWPDRQFWTPRVAWNSYRNEYYVIWNALDTTTQEATDVAGVHVTAETGEPDPAAHIITTYMKPHEADIVYNVAADGYLVVYRSMASNDNGDIRGQFLNREGTPYGANFQIDCQIVDQQNPAVATNSQGTYFVVWQHRGTPTRWDIDGVVLNSWGAQVVGPFPVAVSSYDAMTPDIAASGSGVDEYLTVFEQVTPTGIAIRGRRDRVTTTTTPVNQFEIAPGGFWNNNAPVVAASRVGYFTAYEGDASSDPTVYRHIYGRAWWPQALFLPLTLR